MKPLFPYPITTVLTGALFVAGCQSHSTPPIVCVQPVLLAPEQRTNVWLPDQVAPYTIGRYRDPRDPDVLHEAHTLYRREQTSRPNLAPPAALALPAPGSPSVTGSTAMLRDALTAELNDQRVTSGILVTQVQSVQAVLRGLNQGAQELHQAAQESARLREALQVLSNRVSTIEGTPRPEPPRR